MSALIELMDDPSPIVWTEVKRELLRGGQPAERALARATREGPARGRMRARKLLLELDRARHARRLLRFACATELDLERGLWLLARFEEPGLDVRPYVLALDAMAAEVLRRIEKLAPTAERALVLCQYLGRELGYRGDDEDYHHPDNVYLHRAIVRKRGLPLSLCAIYVLVARRAGIQAAIVPLPGHVMLRLYGSDKSVIVDPFHQGAVRTERDCLKFLAENGLAFQSSWFGDASEAAMFGRQTNNLCASYRRRGLLREVELLELVLGALERVHGGG